MVAEAQFSKQDYVEVAIVEALLIQDLSLVEVDDLAKIQDCLHHIQVELAEYRMVIVKAEMADINLDLFSCGLPFTEFLANLKETLFDLAFHARFQLLFHVVQFQILSFKVLERLFDLFGI